MESTQINWQPAHLESEYVKLVPLQESHFEVLYAVASDPLIWEQHPEKDRYKREVFQKFFDKALAAGSAFLISDKASGEAIGSTRFYDYNQEESSVSVGYTFYARKYWGGSYNRSGKKLMIDYALQYANNVCFFIGSGNVRSQQAIMKIGAVKNREYHLEEFGSQSLHFEYRISKESWL
jgi:RimJ/RimL family protein N-acetyltransferase